jgi:hypothetical protein
VTAAANINNKAMNDMDNILAILDDETPTHVVDAVVCEFMHR